MQLLGQIHEVRWLLLSALFAFFFAKKYHQYRRLQQFPGPPGTGWFGYWHVHTLLSRRIHLRYKEVIDKYGRIARIGPNELVTSSTELFAHMSAVRSPYTRTNWFYKAARFRPGVDHVLSQTNEVLHTKRRQQMAPGYSGKENLSLESDIDIRVQDFLDLLENKYLSTGAQSVPVDIGRKIQYLTLDVISTVGFGEPFGNIKADEDVNNYIKSAEEGIKMIAFIGAVKMASLFTWYPIARLFGPSEKDKGGIGKIIASARKIIDSRLAKPTEGRSDMLVSFMRHGLTRDELLTESVLQIMAGSDTSAIAIRTILLHLITHQQVYRKLQAEIDAAVTSGRADISKGVVTDATTRTLPYLQAVVREGLRVHPPVTNSSSKKVPPGGDTVNIDGEQVFLPGGTEISQSVWSIHHNEALFGADADCFRPDRWLLDEEKDLNRLGAMRRTTDMIFGYGKYQCLGKPVALMEINKVIFEFMRQFDWSLVKPDRPWKSLNYFGLFVQREMYVTITKRPGSEILV